MKGARGYEPRDFRPAPGLANPHAQTLAGRWIRRPGSRLPFRRRRIPTPDGDFLDLDFWDPSAGSARARPGSRLGARPRSRLPPPAAGADEGKDEASPVVLVLHGLEGSSRSGYVVEGCRRLSRGGARPVALNFRGCSGVPNRRPRFYHSGETDDLAHALAWLAERLPSTPLGALGFSLGGNVLLKYLGEAEREVPRALRAAAAVSVPLDLSGSAASLEAGLGRVYARFFLASLRRKVREKARRFPDAVDAAAAERARTLREFDDAVTAPLHGFRDAAHYYRESSAGRHLDGIDRPTLLVHAADDPLACAPELRSGTLDSHPWIVPRITRAGGHVGFVSRRAGTLAPWAEAETARFLRFHLRPERSPGQPSASCRRHMAGRRSSDPARAAPQETGAGSATRRSASGGGDDVEQ